jgi:hypothetical protein
MLNWCSRSGQTIALIFPLRPGHRLRIRRAPAGGVLDRGQSNGFAIPRWHAPHRFSPLNRAVMEPRRAAAFGAIAVAGLFLWQFLTVHYNYGGNWTGLFCINTRTEVPPALEAEHLYTCAIPIGYDGSVFHLIAHDP